jgi:hypothetical protein
MQGARLVRSAPIAGPLWVKVEILTARTGCPLYPRKADIRARSRQVRFVPCVDGSELARAFFTFAALVGAAMCSAF